MITLISAQILMATATAPLPAEISGTVPTWEVTAMQRRERRDGLGGMTDQAKENARAKRRAENPRVICRGGGGIIPIISPQKSTTEIFFRYRAAAKGWMDSNNEIGKGECTFMDRPMTSSDPRYIKLVIPTQGSTSVNWKAFFVPGNRFRSTSFEQIVFAIRATADGPIIDLKEERNGRGRRGHATVMKLDLRGDKYFTIDAWVSGDNLVSKRMVKGPPLYVQTRPRGEVRTHQPEQTTTQQGDGTPQKAKVRRRRPR